MTTSLADKKQRAHDAIASLAPGLIALSREIHAHPELAFQERHACATIIPFLRDHGFAVNERACGLETAFRAAWGRGPVTIALCAEYDALPEIGHACGHNLIAAASIGAAVALTRALDPSDARVLLVGTPAEEGGGGKIMLVERGCFDDVDVAMMAHPGPYDAVYTLIQGGARVEAVFTGKAAHQAGAPELGRNALDAIVTAYNGISQLRQHIRRDARLGAIITHGGDAVNVIPERASGIFSARAATIAYLDELKQRLRACLEAGALATGCRLDMKWSGVEYAPFRHNHPLADAYLANGTSLGKTFRDFSNIAVGGTDMANVSQAVPSIHPEFAIGDGRAIQNHTRDFTDASITSHAFDAMLDAARMLAMTAADAALDAALLRDIRAAFAATTSGDQIARSMP